jgi:myosin heavy subunit
MKIRFSASSERSLTMVGCHTDHYLLEKARVTSHAPGERNFHVFYQVLRGCPPEQREALHITSKETTDFDVLLAADGSKTSYEGIDDAEDFSNMTRAFSNLGFSPDESEELLRVVVGLLFLGNMRFAEGGDGEHAVPVDDCTVSPPPPPLPPAPLPFLPSLSFQLDNNNAADLLGLDPDFLARSLSTKVRTVRSETITSPLTAPASDAARDALSKKTYSLTFDWLMRRINTSMHVPDGAIESFIGILDIFGFEIFEDNRFEQVSPSARERSER